MNSIHAAQVDLIVNSIHPAVGRFNSEQPIIARIDHGVRLGQIYEKHKGGNSAGRVIQIAELLKDGRKIHRENLPGSDVS